MTLKCPVCQGGLASPARHCHKCNAEFDDKAYASLLGQQELLDEAQKLRAAVENINASLAAIEGKLAYLQGSLKQEVARDLPPGPELVSAETVKQVDEEYDRNKIDPLTFIPEGARAKGRKMKRKRISDGKLADETEQEESLVERALGNKGPVIAAVLGIALAVWYFVYR